MYKVLKFGVYFGVVASLAGCSASEHFMQDDVYNTRTPMMPPGTDLNDVTDYATFVAKKEQTEIPQERTTYVSPRQYTDYFYYSRFMNYGYSPYAPVSGLSYYGYGNYYQPMYGFGNNGIYAGSMYPYGYSSAYYGYSHSYYGGNSWGTYPMSSSWNYSPKSKPNSPGNLSNAHAGTSSGRMGSTTNNGVVSYTNQLMAKPTTKAYSGVGRNTTISSPVGAGTSTSSGRTVAVNSRETIRPVATGRTSIPTTERTTYNRTIESNPNSGMNNRTINSNPSTRTSSPPSSIRSSSGGSSGGSISSPSSGGGSRSGGRR